MAGAAVKPDVFDELPDEVQELLRPHLIAQSPTSLDAISVMIAKRRDEAKTARTASGIESTWRDCEEAYLGVDDANRQEFQSAKWSKPMSMDGPVTTGKTPGKTDYKSTVFVRLTARYVDAGAAKLGEILLPSDDKAFSFSETPVPELIKAKDDNTQVVHEQLGPLTRPLRPDEQPPPAVVAPNNPPPAGANATPGAGAAPGVGAVPPPGAAAPPQVPLTVADLAKEAIELAREKAKKAEKRIYDWMVECQHTAEMRKVIFDAARLGVGVVKAPTPKPTRAMAYVDGTLQIKEKISPATVWKDPWNIFPDPACGESIHDGDYIFERDYISERQLRELKKIPGYIETQIDRVLEEGPNGVFKDDNAKAKAELKDRYEVWYYYGVLKPEEMDLLQLAAKQPPNNKPEKGVFAIVTMVNDCVIRASINPLDSGSFPYHSVPWQRRSGHWAGIGVAEQINVPQKMLNAASRAMLNNAGKSAGSQIIVDQSAVKPADGNWVMTPDKIWYKTGDSEGNDVRAAMAMFEIPNVTDQLMKIIEYALKLAEESTSIPLITQGQTGPTTPDTLGATQLQNNNANQLLRSIGYAFDDYVTEPVVRQYYEWLLLDPDVPDDEKGEFTINAHGSAALVERAIQDQTIAQMGNMALNPAYGIDPKKWFEMMAKSKRLDPKDLQYTEEEEAKLAQQQPPPAPAVQVAQIKAATDEKKLAADAQAKQGDQALEKQSIDNTHQKALTDATVELHKLELQKELALLEYANREKVTIAQAKADIAQTVMKLNTQKELNAADQAVDLHKHHNPPRQPRGMKPPVQVPGRAGNGRAFEQAGPAQ